jgi:hypothetical protein
MADLPPARSERNVDRHRCNSSLASCKQTRDVEVDGIDQRFGEQAAGETDRHQDLKGGELLRIARIGLADQFCVDHVAGRSAVPCTRRRSKTPIHPIGGMVQAFSLICPISGLLAVPVFPVGFVQSLCKKPLWHRHFYRVCGRERTPDLAVSQLISLLPGNAPSAGFR